MFDIPDVIFFRSLSILVSKVFPPKLDFNSIIVLLLGFHLKYKIGKTNIKLKTSKIFRKAKTQ